jgi:transcriptional regulator with XRE-family HTH domain
LSQRLVAGAVGISRPQYGRIERGLAPQVSLERVATIATVLGLEPSLRFFPSGDPIRDAGHAALLQRLHVRCHRSLVWSTEVAFPKPGDRRSWDALIRGVDPVSGDWWRAGVEAETHPNDLQALDRKLALKERDGGADWLVLLLLASRHNRALLAAHGAALRARFPLLARRALELLAAGAPLGGNALIVL